RPVFGPSGEIFFRRADGSSSFLYGVQEDGSGLRRASDQPIMGLRGGPSDRNWLVLAIASEGLRLLRAGGGASVPTKITGSAEIGWSGDGKHFVLERGALTTLQNAYIFPLTQGRLVPESLLTGFPSEQEMSKLPGVLTIPSRDVALGPTADMYAFT